MQSPRPINQLKQLDLGQPLISETTGSLLEAALVYRIFTLHHCQQIMLTRFIKLCCSQFPLKEHDVWVSAKTASKPPQSWFIFTTILVYPHYDSVRSTAAMLSPTMPTEQHVHAQTQMNVAVMMLSAVFKELRFLYKPQI